MTDSPNRASWNRIWTSPWFKAGALVIVTLVVYWPALKAGFIWDDDAHLTENPCITGTLGFEEIWTSPRAVYYPLVLTTFWVLHKFVGLSPLPFHLLNLLTHSAAVILLWRVLRQLQLRGAWLGALLWALHPVTVESVAWVTEMKNTQSCFFYLLSILFFLKSNAGRTGREQRWAPLILSLFFFALAITSKPSTVMLPVVLGLCLWWTGRLNLRQLIFIAPFVLISAGASAWTIWEQKYHSHALGIEWSETWLQRVAIAGWNLWFYLGKLIWPHPLIFIYPRWRIDPHPFIVFLPTLAAAAGLIFLWWKRHGRLRPVFFAAAYFTVSLLPVLGFFNVYFFRYSFVSDHFQYLASMGPLVLAASGLMTMFGHFREKEPWIAAAVCGPLLLVLGTLSRQHLTIFNDLETLWRVTIAQNPACWLAHTNLGVLLEAQGRNSEAQMHYREALKAKPDFPEALTALGASKARAGQIDDAIVDFKAALTASPQFQPAFFNLGKALAAQNKLDDAIICYRAAIRGDSLVYFEARVGLGVALSRAGRFEEAVEQYVEALRVKPNDAGAHNNLGVALGQLNDFDGALENFKEALRLDPNAAQTYVNLANVLARVGRRNEAIENLHAALRIQPDHAEAKFRLQELGAPAPE